jgi:hypothetical protein
MIHRLVFDTTSAGTIAASSNVGAYIRASDGTLIDAVAIAGVDRLAVDATTKDGAGNDITSTTVGAANGLDVNIINPIVVDIDGVYDAVDNPLPDNVGQIVHTRATAPDETNQTVRTTGASPTADNITPGDVHASDVNSFLMAFDNAGGNYDRVTSSAGALDVNLASQDGTITVSDAALANTAISQAAIGVAASAALFAAPLANRKYALIYNNGNQEIYVGASGVDATSGFPVFPGSLLELRAGASVAIHAVAAAGTQNTRLLQLS